MKLSVSVKTILKTILTQQRFIFKNYPNVLAKGIQSSLSFRQQALRAEEAQKSHFKSFTRVLEGFYIPGFYGVLTFHNIQAVQPPESILAGVIEGVEPNLRGTC